MRELNIIRCVREHAFFAGVSDDHCDEIAAFSELATFVTDAPLFRADEAADRLYLIRHGKVSLRSRSGSAFLTVDRDEMVGEAWCFAPYQWTHDAVALEGVTALAVDAARLREICERDPELGYMLLQRVGTIVHDQVLHANLQLMDMYR